MILICGIPTEPSLQRVIHALAEMNAPAVIFNQRDFQQSRLNWKLQNGRISGLLQMGENRYPLEDFQGIYARLMDENTLPEMREAEQDSALKAECHRLHAGLMSWMDLADARVVNRPQAMLSNGSKPYQLQLIRRQGFDIPDTLITNDPQRVAGFRKKYGRIIYKSISGVRSVVKEFDAEDEKKLNRIRWCPVQFQELIGGFDVRVHVIGETVIATKIISAATDYRYAGRENKTTRLEPFHLPAELEKKCVALATSLGLPFAGIDLRFSPDSRVVCFEVNPSPGYSYYEEQTGQAISMAVAEFLISEE